MAKALQFLFFFAVLIVVWCVVLLFALPEEQLEGLLRENLLPSLAALLVLPPFFVVTALKTSFWAWGWRKKRAEKRAEAKKIAEQQAAQEAARLERQRKHALRRAHVECRATWAALLEIPDWCEGNSAPYVLESLDARKIQGVGREAALTSSLQLVFEMVLFKCEALPFLTVMLVTDNPIQNQKLWAEKAWQQAVEAIELENIPAHPDFEILTGSGSISDRVIALFEQNPDLPAVLLVGMDSPLAEADDLEEPNQPKHRKPGHAAVALLLSRSGLAIPEGAQPPKPKRVIDDWTPFWEREEAHVPDWPGWGRIPPMMRPGFLEKFPPLVALTRPRQAAMSERPSISTRNLQQALDEAFIDAALRDPPIDENENSQKKADADQDEQIAPEIGWMVHDGDANRFPLVAGALCGCRSDLNPIAQASDVLQEQGDVGAAHNALMQALALIRAAQLKLPVLVVETLDKDKTTIAFVRPC